MSTLIIKKFKTYKLQCKKCKTIYYFGFYPSIKDLICNVCGLYKRNILLTGLCSVCGNKKEFIYYNKKSKCTHYNNSFDIINLGCF